MRIMATVVAIAGCTLVSSACESVVSPCTSEAEQNVGRAGNGKLMDGTWALATIDGNPIPDPGFQVAPGQFIRAGILHFRTERLAGSCDDPDDSSGSVIVQLVLVDGAGIARPGLSSSGGFEYFPGTDVVRFKAFDRETSGIADASRLVVRNLVPERFANLELEFKR
jgi:hypothetical protein